MFLSDDKQDIEVNGHRYHSFLITRVYHVARLHVHGVNAILLLKLFLIIFLIRVIF